MKHIVVATKNAGKAAEFKRFFESFHITSSSLLDFDKEMPDIAETGHTFAQNAALKAETMAAELNETVVADDSGLAVDALGQEPGVYSARYAGEPKNDQNNLQKVLTKLENVPYEARTARFVCVLAVATPGEATIYRTGYCQGRITMQPRGNNGFGYDPIFVPDNYTSTMAELPADEKNRISHRKQAFDQLEDWLNTL